MEGKTGGIGTQKEDRQQCRVISRIFFPQNGPPARSAPHSRLRKMPEAQLVIPKIRNKSAVTHMESGGFRIPVIRLVPERI